MRIKSPPLGGKQLFKLTALTSKLLPTRLGKMNKLMLPKPDLIHSRICSKNVVNGTPKQGDRRSAEGIKNPARIEHGSRSDKGKEFGRMNPELEAHGSNSARDRWSENG
jgi:hypothetical protein